MMITDAKQWTQLVSNITRIEFSKLIFKFKRNILILPNLKHF